MFLGNLFCEFCGKLIVHVLLHEMVSRWILLIQFLFEIMTGILVTYAQYLMEISMILLTCGLVTLKIWNW